MSTTATRGYRTLSDWALSTRTGPGTFGLVDDAGNLLRIADADLPMLVAAIDAHRSATPVDTRTFIAGSTAARAKANRAARNGSVR